MVYIHRLAEEAGFQVGWYERSGVYRIQSTIAGEDLSGCLAAFARAVLEEAAKAVEGQYAESEHESAEVIRALKP